MSDLTQVRITENSDVIIPPPDLKPIINTTAQYVAKKGISLEKQIIERQKNNPKFSFLTKENPYNAFYRKQIGIYKADGASPTTEDTKNNLKPENHSEKTTKTETGIKEGEKDPNIQTEPTTDDKEKEPDSPKKKPLLDRIAEIVDNATKPKEKWIKKEKELSYAEKVPADVVATDIEIIKLTALMAAVNGRAFLAAVTNREQKNPQFSFLKPTNTNLFLYFSDLVQAFQRIINPPEEMFSVLKKECEDETAIYDKILGVAEYNQRERRRNELAIKDKEDEKREMMLIDWNSFVILETIDFNDGDDEYLPPPSMSIEEINEQLEAEKRLIDNIEKVGVKYTDEALDQMENKKEKEENERDNSKYESITIQNKDTFEIEKEKIPVLENDQEEQLRLKRKFEQPKTQYQKCTVCGQNIPVNEIEEHVRIELLDPKWREQKQIEESKSKESTLAEPSEMTRNLREFVRIRKRPFDRPRPETEGAVEDLQSTQSIASPEQMHHQGITNVGIESDLEKTKKAMAAIQKSFDIQNQFDLNNKENAIESTAKKSEEMKGEVTSKMNQSEAKPASKSKIDNGVTKIVPNQNLKQNLNQTQTPNINPNFPQNLKQFPQSVNSQNQRPIPPQSQFGPPLMRMPLHHPNLGLFPNAPMRPVNAENSIPSQIIQSASQAQHNVPISMPPLAMPMPMPMQPTNAPGSGRPPLMRPVATLSKGFVKTSDLPGMMGSNQFMPEALFLKTHDVNVVLRIKIPNDVSKKDWNFVGQTLSLPARLTDSLAAVKKVVSQKLNGMPAKKMKLRISGGVFLKDNFTLGYYNITSAVLIELGVKARGGRK